MTDYGTIKIPSEAYDRHNERRKDLGMTWAEYIDAEAPDRTVATGDVGPVELEATEVNKIADEIEARLR